jgi:hypothetical protein
MEIIITAWAIAVRSSGWNDSNETAFDSMSSAHPDALVKLLKLHNI